MRGHGTVVPCRLRALLTEMAEGLGIDSLRIRQINMRRRSLTFTCMPSGFGYGVPVPREGQGRLGLGGRKGRLPKGRGLGIALSHFVSGDLDAQALDGEPHATVNLRLRRRHHPAHHTADISQGSNTMASQVAAEVLGVRLDRIRVISADRR